MKVARYTDKPFSKLCEQVQLPLVMCSSTLPGSHDLNLSLEPLEH